MKILLALAFLSAGVFAQASECKLPIEKAPSIAKVRLGLDEIAVGKALNSPLIVPVAIETGTGSTYPLKPGERTPRERKYDVGVRSWSARTSVLIPKSLRNVTRLQLDFYQDKLYEVTVLYSDFDFQWEDMNDVVAHLAASWAIPTGYWAVNNSSAQLNCGSFSVLAVSRNSRQLGIMLVDLKARGEIRDKLTKVMLAEDQKDGRTPEEKKKAFKP